MKEVKETKTKVRFLMSIAGCGDPDHVKLDQEYAELTQRMLKMGAKQPAIDRMIASKKEKDRYNADPVGMPNDWRFKPEGVSEVPADLAQKWEQAGICVILPANKERSA
jgi:hypothetical protein